MTRRLLQGLLKKKKERKRESKHFMIYYIQKSFKSDQHVCKILEYFVSKELAYLTIAAVKQNFMAKELLRQLKECLGILQQHMKGSSTKLEEKSACFFKF